MNKTSILERYFYFIASLILTGYFLVISKYLLNPLIAALILSLALNPLVVKLEQYNIPRFISTILTLFAFIMIFLFIIAFITIGIGTFDLSKYEWQLTGFNGVIAYIQNLLNRTVGISGFELSNMLKDSLTNFLNQSISILHNTVAFTTYFLTSFVIFILAMFFSIYYRDVFMNFLYKVFDKKNHARVDKTVMRILIVVSHYVFGLSLVIAILAIANSLGLLIIGIPHAVFLGVVAAVLNIIPYIGVVIGSMIPIIIALLTMDSLWYPFFVLLLFTFIQFVEGNFLTPNIVGRQVRINPFAAILVLIVGGMLLGIIGIIFALPLLAIIKIICDEVESLKPFGYLIGSHKIQKTDN